VRSSRLTSFTGHRVTVRPWRTVAHRDPGEIEIEVAHPGAAATVERDVQRRRNDFSPGFTSKYTNASLARHERVKLVAGHAAHLEFLREGLPLALS